MVDSIFLISALVISESFTERDQAVAGAVVTTIANMGQSLGLASIAVVTNSVTQSKSDVGSVQGLLEGYRAGTYLRLLSYKTNLTKSLCRVLGCVRVDAFERSCWRPRPEKSG